MNIFHVISNFTRDGLYIKEIELSYHKIFVALLLLIDQFNGNVSLFSFHVLHKYKISIVIISNQDISNKFFTIMITERFRWASRV